MTEQEMIGKSSEEQQMEVQTERPAARRVHKVGTVTLGIMLVLFGGVFLAHIFVPTLTYNVIWHLWPCTLISLGIEVLVSTFWTEKAKYDGWGILLIFLITMFAMGMAGMEWMYDYWITYYHYL